MANLKETLLSKKPLNEQEEKDNIESAYSRIYQEEELSALIKANNLAKDDVSNSLVSLISFMDDKKRCEGCVNYASCPKGERKGFIYSLRYDPFSRRLELVSNYCTKYCLIKKSLANIIFSDIDPLETYYAYSNLRHTSFKSSLEGSFASGVIACQQVIAKKGEKNNILIQDKTLNSYYLLLSLAFSQAKKGKKVAIIDAKRTLNDCLSLDNSIKNDAMSCLTSALKSEVLFILDLGGEYKSATFRDQILLPMLKERNSPLKSTFISTGLDLDLLISSYAKNDRNMQSQLNDYFTSLFSIIQVNDIAYF